jgi:patatin-like phospholipase
MMSEIVSYIQGQAVPVERGRGAEAGEPPPTFTSTDQAVTVRSQMAEFSAAVPQSIRPAISNGLLLGQLAADKATESNPDPAAYFSAFNGVMKKIGWQITESGLTQQSISDNNAELHKAVIPIVTAKFPSDPLQKPLDDQLVAETTLESDKIRTGLMIMTKRLDTGSPWPLNNGSRGKFAAQEGALRLTQIVRASTAAPTYFDPERIEISSRDGSVVDGEFVDGGVSPFNDPALQLLMLAALDGHGFRWHVGKSQLLIISVGTGSYRSSSQSPRLIDRVAAVQGLRALNSLMDDCARVNQTMLQWLTDCLTPWLIDRAVGDMKLDSQAGPQLATYVRYNAVLEQAWLKTELGVDLAGDKLEQIRKMDDPSNLSDLANLGRLAAAKQVKAEHLPAAFDLAKTAA